MEGSTRSHLRYPSFWRFALIFTFFLLSYPLSTAKADEAQWIWATGASLDTPVQAGASCFFRKTINLKIRAEGHIEIAADDEYELYVNGRRVGSGKSSRQMDEYNITDYLEVGRNIVAVRVNNTHGDKSALAARVAVLPEGSEQWYTFSSDPSWKTSDVEDSMWETTLYNDHLWGVASSFGKLGDTAPWDRDEDVKVAAQTEQRERFQIQRGFGVQRVLKDEQIGSVIAMTFNEFGHIIASRENGPLMLVFDRDEDGVPEQVRTYCDQVKSCQGILALNGEVFVTGDGPQGLALYRLTDTDRNGSLEKVKAIVKFKGKSGEYGPHGLQLGPDGMIYVSLGNQVQAMGKTGAGETYRDAYEGDLLPRYEDPSGQSAGVKAPGGTIIRTNIDGTVIERVAGGIRNAYDLSFHPSGKLFVHDSDMASDIGTPWYRPTALFDVTEGGEFGWRSGWSKWPDHYLDRLPNLLDTGRGSPTGATCYEHYMFPVRYQNTLFVADWSGGRILNVRLKERGAGFIADSEVFLKGQPLNVTDLEIGPDGALYFCTGGRGTSGGIYRVVYKGEIPDRMKNLGTGIAAAVRQPQIGSAWTRQEIASIKRELGDQWGQLIAGVAYSDDNPPHYRTRALDLMELFGPVPSSELLHELSRAANEAVRARAATAIGLHPDAETTQRLTEMLTDQNAQVQRAACEAMLRSGKVPETVDPVLELLASDDRTLAFIARRVLERMHLHLWRDEVLSNSDTRIALQGMLALMNADPTQANAIRVLTRASEMMTDFLSDADFVDTLRVCQIALHCGNVDPSKLTPLRDQIAEEFPAGENRMNHELIRLAAYLKANQVADRALDFIDSDAPLADRSLVAMCLPQFDNEWTAEQRFRILKYYENTATGATNSALSMYLAGVTRDFAKSLSNDDVQAILEQGNVWRNAALAAIYKLPRPIDSKTTDTLIQLDRKLVADPQVGDVQRRLRTGITAMLSTSTEKHAGDYLRSTWRSEPERRAIIAMALAQAPEGENWDYLVRSLNILEGEAASEVIGALKSVPIATDDPMAIRQLILLGVRAQASGKSFENVEQLLEHWTGMQRPSEAKLSMAPWQKWYAKTYPDRPNAAMPNADESRWDLDQVVAYLESDKGRLGDPELGHHVFAKARCVQCHQFGGEGESIGPDLTSISRRFTKREIVESILFPAHLVNEKFASKKVKTLDEKTYVGLVTTESDGTVLIRDSNNRIARAEEKQVDQILPSNASIMPSGLLDELSTQQISNLMSYLGVVPAAEVAARDSDRH
ncbi:cryptic beta-D-galactosidase subunit alpha [Planctomycetes bacterium CA13]|uniref:Cryptic beta-D-galactosidase subunit alpha n=1 Tax=Novipirellula herctigrandis TaxID=2527986 RepID=A0A5C5Z5A1_9BACT|nr:cryptic beta-D-galactosidase subunit alpha [Planctomycetes bacterium CA13]